MADPVIEALHALARKELKLTELPEGDLAEHLDSVERLTLVVAIEDHFRITLEPADEELVNTLDDVVALVHRKLAEQRHG